jgi:hypothetical protein
MRKALLIGLALYLVIGLAVAAVQAVDRVLAIEQRRHQLALAAAAAAPAEPTPEPRVSKLGQLRAIHGGSSG